MSILIGADVAPTEVNVEIFNKANLTQLLGSKLLNIWSGSDFRLFNLELPLVDEENPIEKQGPNLIAPTSTVKGIKALSPSLITLANNHILDHGKNGLFSTIDLLNKNDISYIGAAENISKAAKPYYFNWNKRKIGVYSCAEHEFNIATENSAGANPFDPFESLDHISQIKSNCDYVIVVYHGGKEHYRYPSPHLQKTCRKIVEKGANLVICQHSHCIGSFEEYQNSTIIYGQGNFVFNKCDNEFWNTSLLIKINDEFKIEYIPLKTSKVGTELAIDEEANYILEEFYKRSEDIQRDDFVEEAYQQFAEENLSKYIRNIARFRKWKSRFDRYVFKNKLSQNYYTKKELLAIRNYIECEAHRELLIRGIKGKK